MTAYLKWFSEVNPAFYWPYFNINFVLFQCINFRYLQYNSHNKTFCCEANTEGYTGGVSLKAF